MPSTRSVEHVTESTSRGKAHLQDFSDTFLTFLKTCLDITGYGQARGEWDTWPSCCKKLTKKSITDDVDRAVTLCDPVYKLSTRKVVSNVEYIVNNLTYRTSSFVCMRCVWWTGCCPWQANAAWIEPLCPLIGCPLKALSTASFPQQATAWCFRFVVEDLSFESWYRRTPPVELLHFRAPHGKKCTSRPSMCSTVTASSLKNE